jgi:CubicO group peptidase (beta-lactamase class C family)
MKPLRWTTITLLCLALLLAHANANALDGLADWIEAERERWGVPGLAIAVVHEDEVVFAEGFGRLGLDDDRAVDADTQFGIASLSKAMTATALGLMVEEGKLDWDDRVIDHLPEFRLGDDWVTGQVTIRDLLSHRVGVGRLFGNRLTFMPGRSRAEFMAHLRHHDFERPFREGYVYSNAMYTVAGEVLERVSGQSWESFLAERLFTPLGMTRSNTSIDDLDGNAALPHQDIDGELVSIERRDWGYSGPAAAVNSSMNDLARWMRFNLGESGELGGEVLMDAEVVEDMHAPSSLTGFDSDEQAINGYGLGWGIGRYRGYHVLRHGGATDGFNSQIWLLPELDLGIVMSANTFTAMRDPVFKHIIDRVAGLEERDRADEAHANYLEQRQEAREAREAVHAARQADTRPSRELEAYIGRYHDPLYDTVEVELVDGALKVTFWDDDSQVLELEHWHHDTFRGRWKNPAQREKFVWFTLDEDGQPDGLKVRFTLRPKLLQEGIYPADYTRVVRFDRGE